MHELHDGGQPWAESGTFLPTDRFCNRSGQRAWCHVRVLLFGQAHTYQMLLTVPHFCANDTRCTLTMAYMIGRHIDRAFRKNSTTRGGHQL